MVGQRSYDKRLPGATVADIQAAVDKAAGSNEKYQLKVTSTDWDVLRTAHLKRFFATDGKVRSCRRLEQLLL